MPIAMNRPRLTAELRRETLIEAARAIAIEKSLDAITMEGVAARAGVNKALVYRHLSDADAVRAALLERETAAIGMSIAGKLRTAKGLEARLAVILDVWLTAVGESGGYLRALLWSRSEGVHKHKREGRGALAGLIADEIRAASDLDPETAAFAASILIAATNGVTEDMLASPAKLKAAKKMFLAAALGMIDGLEKV
jgi:AcrR family transcriptional regulator